MEKIEESKLYNLLKTFNSGEWKQFSLFLQSPLHNRREDTWRLQKYLRLQIRNNIKTINTLRAYKSVFPNESYDGLKLRGTMSDLLQLAEEYLLTAQAKEKTLSNTLAIAEIYRRRRLDKHFKWVIKKSSRLIEQQALKNEAYLRKHLQFQMENMQFQSRTQRTADLKLQDISDNIDRLYLLQKLRHACTQLSHQAVYHKKYDYGLLPSILESLDENALTDWPMIAVYYHCFRFLTATTPSNHFQQFRSLLLKHMELFTPEENKDLFLFAINFCIRQMNKGEKSFIAEAFALYQEALKVGFLIEENEMSRFAFNNIVGIALMMESYDWTASFIDDYHTYVNEAYRPATLSLNHARLAFATQKYDQAIYHLQTAEYKDLVNNLISRMLLIKIYYLQGAWEPLEAQLTNLDHFIRRAALSQFHKENYQQIIRFIRRLIALPPYDEEKKAQLYQDISNSSSLSEKSWLLEQLD